MTAPPHRIRRLVLELIVPDQDSAWPLQSEAARIHKESLETIIDQACTEAGEPGRLHRIASLVVDLGVIRKENLEQDLIERLTARLREALSARILEEEQTAAAAGERSEVTSGLDILEYFARTGNLPWWADSSRAGVIDETMGLLLQAAPRPLTALLRGLALDTGALRRIVAHCEDARLAGLFDAIAASRAVASRETAASSMTARAARRSAEVMALLQSKVTLLEILPSELRTVIWLAALEEISLGESPSGEPTPLWRGILTRASIHLGVTSSSLLVSIIDSMKRIQRSGAGGERDGAGDERSGTGDGGAWLLETIVVSLARELGITADAPPDMADIPPDVADPPPDIADTPPDVADIPPDVADIPPDMADAPPDMADTPPDMADTPPDVADIPPDVADIPPDIADTPPDLADTPPDVADIPPDLADIPPDMADTPPATADTSGPSSDTTDPTTPHPSEASDAASSGGRTRPRRLARLSERQAPEQAKRSEARERVSASERRRETPPARGEPAPSARRELAPSARHERPLTFSDTDEVYVHDSGLIILWPFLTTFFDRLELTSEKQFKDPPSLHRAVGLLGYLATMDPSPPEYQLALPKALCGMDMTDVFDFGPPVTDDEAAECEGLLSAVIANAPILRDMSIEGFRGSFLLRSGALGATAGTWLLRVERVSYDVVLDRFPWSFSWIRLPWMQAPLNVEW